MRRNWQHIHISLPCSQVIQQYRAVLVRDHVISTTESCEDRSSEKCAVKRRPRRSCGRTVQQGQRAMIRRYPSNSKKFYMNRNSAASKTQHCVSRRDTVGRHERDEQARGVEQLSCESDKYEGSAGTQRKFGQERCSQSTEIPPTYPSQLRNDLFTS